jgi:cytochrome c biogenesis protein CcdA
LATNIAAISVLARKVGSTRRALAGAVAYTLGRVSVYGLLALVVGIGLASMPRVAMWLRQEILPLIGPILILAGMAVPRWLPLPINLRLTGEDTAAEMSKRGLVGEFLLGALFALSFCPTSAALFFGSLMPVALAATAGAPVLVGLYGVGTALPVGLMAILLVVSSEKAAKALGRIQASQVWVRRVTGVVIIAAGIYLTVFHTIMPVLAG